MHKKSNIHIYYLSGNAVLYALLGCVVYCETYYNIMIITTPLILVSIVILISLGLARKMTAWFLPLSFSFSLQGESYNEEQAMPDEPSCLDRYEERQTALLQKEKERRKDIIRTINEYVAEVTTGYLSKESLTVLIDNISHLACGEFDAYRPLRSDMEKTLKSPDLRHLAWNIGERLGISRSQRVRFILASFPYELQNATKEYLEANLRDSVPSHISIDVPKKGDYHFKNRSSDDV